MVAMMLESAPPLPPGIAVPGEPQNPITQRRYPEPPHAYRSPFARDAARVLHARAFRRLAGKTQVFTRLPGELMTDHFRSRLTHTLEVAQISRTLARALGLNAELAEALALAHDIGHPPFGHAGKRRSTAHSASTASASITICTRCASSPGSRNAIRPFAA